ncbi:uncharacterized protein BDR25DRAFT_361820 [Lindgomyces ingoldianus]|uniref:Uncharacterized protein n=1 Tax=Lindgomyces ingoldianus TaxID=673940 RepID=A0ACB6QDX1_9PLEO|nr:uncharacterized protein BDR25DRAFT_361820 [Lindgomyces ingoldianus]KAF2464317.1 hypothetical protein BDR25DRAFT_361820 [Lindgomyces ingoldianus]
MKAEHASYACKGTLNGSSRFLGERALPRSIYVARGGSMDLSLDTGYVRGRYLSLKHVEAAEHEWEGGLIPRLEKMVTDPYVGWMDEWRNRKADCWGTLIAFKFRSTGCMKQFRYQNAEGKYVRTGMSIDIPLGNRASHSLLAKPFLNRTLLLKPIRGIMSNEGGKGRTMKNHYRVHEANDN